MREGMILPLRTGRKGQKSLEMIIGLVILLVVAGVIISMFIKTFSEDPRKQAALCEQTFETACGQQCKAVRDAQSQFQKLEEAFKYCSTFYPSCGQATEGFSQLVVDGTGFLSHCQDREYCFIGQECVVDRTTKFVLDAKTCAKLMCQALTFGDAGVTAGKATDIISRKMEPGSCELRSGGDSPIERKTWWELYFEDPVCGAPTSGGSGGGDTTQQNRCSDACKAEGYEGASPSDGCISLLSCTGENTAPYPNDAPSFCNVDAFETCCCTTSAGF